jgi:hypothetical protein
METFDNFSTLNTAKRRHADFTENLHLLHNHRVQCERPTFFSAGKQGRFWLYPPMETFPNVSILNIAKSDRLNAEHVCDEWQISARVGVLAVFQRLNLGDTS